MSQTSALAAMWGQSRLEQEAADAALHLATHPAETGGWRRPIRPQIVPPVAPATAAQSHVAPSEIRAMVVPILDEETRANAGAVRRSAPKVPVARRCEGGVPRLRTFADYRARLGDSPVACELEEAWLSSDVWALHSSAGEDEEVGAYAVTNRRGRVELTLFYLTGPSARSGEVALLHAIAKHHITSAVVSTTDSYMMGMLLDLELASFTPRTQVFTYGGNEPRFALLPKIHWPSSPRGHPGQLQSLADGESGSEATVRLATGSDCGRLATLIGEVFPEFSRRVAANQMLIAVVQCGDKTERIVGAAWWAPSTLQITQDEAAKSIYSTSRPSRLRDQAFDPAAAIEAFVCRDYRRKGVGCSLVTAVIQAVRRSGLAPVASCCTTDAEGASSSRDALDWRSVLEAGGMVCLSRLVEVALVK